MEQNSENACVHDLFLKSWRHMKKSKLKHTNPTKKAQICVLIDSTNLINGHCVRKKIYSKFQDVCVENG